MNTNNNFEPMSYNINGAVGTCMIRRGTFAQLLERWPDFPKGSNCENCGEFYFVDLKCDFNKYMWRGRCAPRFTLALKFQKDESGNITHISNAGGAHWEGCWSLCGRENQIDSDELIIDAHL